jgi:hypothetical protein
MKCFGQAFESSSRLFLLPLAAMGIMFHAGIDRPFILHPIFFVNYQETQESNHELIDYESLVVLC